MRGWAIGATIAGLAAFLAIAIPRAGLAADPAPEPPAYPTTPSPPEKTPHPHRFVAEAAIQEAWGTMGDWKDAMSELEARSIAAGLPVTKSNNPAYTTSFDALAMAALLPRLYVGLHYDRLTGKSEFEVRESLDPGGLGGSTEFPTTAEGTSNAWMFVMRWMIPGDRRGVRPFLQADAGGGSARFDFSSSGAVAQAKGRGFAGSAEIGLQVGDGPARVRITTGYRVHRVPLSYRIVRAGSQVGLARYYFDFDDELRAFVAGHDLDLSGPFARLGMAISWSR